MKQVLNFNETWFLYQLVFLLRSFTLGHFKKAIMCLPDSSNLFRGNSPAIYCTHCFLRVGWFWTHCEAKRMWHGFKTCKDRTVGLISTVPIKNWLKSNCGNFPDGRFQAVSYVQEWDCKLRKTCNHSALSEGFSSNRDLPLRDALPNYYLRLTAEQSLLPALTHC